MTNKHRLIERDRPIGLHVVVSLVAIAVIGAGIATSIFMNCVNRSLWLDEAMLAVSFCKHPFFQLWNGPFEWLQSAPLGWLYLAKTLSVLLGNTEFVLRIPSILGYILTMVVQFALLKRLSVPTSFSLCGCAFYANLPFILKYSNVFKPYIFDGFVVLLAVFVYGLFERGRIRAWVLGLIWAILIWFSTPVCFFEGGVLLAAGIPCLIRKDFNGLKPLVIVGAMIVASFAACYFFWLGQGSTVQGMQEFWEGQDFPLIPTSKEELEKMVGMTDELFKHFEGWRPTVQWILLFTLPAALKRKQTMVNGCYLGIFVCLFASWIKMYPIEDRMWFFMYPVVIALAIHGLYCLSGEDNWWSRVLFCLTIGLFFYPRFQWVGLVIAVLISMAVSKLLSPKIVLKAATWLALIMAVALVFSAGGIRQYLNHAEAVYWNGEELNTELDYLDENLKSDEQIYVYYHSVPGFQFKNGYDNDSFGGYSGNVTYGTTFFQETDECENEIAAIVGRDKTYIVTSHMWPSRMTRLVDAIHAEGYLQLVSNEYDTPLWFYCRDLVQSKIHVSYETADIKTLDGQKTIKVKLRNDGPAYINHQFENVCLVNELTGEQYKLPKNIKPGAGVMLTLTCAAESRPVFRLENEFGLICANSDYVPGYGDTDMYHISSEGVCTPVNQDRPMAWNVRATDAGIVYEADYFSAKGGNLLEVEMTFADDLDGIGHIEAQYSPDGEDWRFVKSSELVRTNRLVAVYYPDDVEIGKIRIVLNSAYAREDGMGLPETFIRVYRDSSLYRYIASSHNEEELGRMLDGTLNTRWSSNTPYAAGMFLEWGYSKEVVVDRVRLALGISTEDYSRDLAVYVQAADGAWKRIEAAYLDDNETIQFNEAQRCTAIRIEQQSDAQEHIWWSVAELIATPVDYRNCEGLTWEAGETASMVQSIEANYCPEKAGNMIDKTVKTTGAMAYGWDSETPQSPDMVITLELVPDNSVKGLHIDSGWDCFAIARQLEIMGSDDGAAWERVPYHFMTSCNLVFDSEKEYRYYKLRQTGTDKKHSWAICDLGLLKDRTETEDADN